MFQRHTQRSIKVKKYFFQKFHCRIVVVMCHIHCHIHEYDKEYEYDNNNNGYSRNNGYFFCNNYTTKLQ